MNTILVIAWGLRKGLDHMVFIFYREEEMAPLSCRGWRDSRLAGCNLSVVVVGKPRGTSRVGRWTGGELGGVAGLAGARPVTGPCSPRGVRFHPPRRRVAAPTGANEIKPSATDASPLTIAPSRPSQNTSAICDGSRATTEAEANGYTPLLRSLCNYFCGY